LTLQTRSLQADQTHCNLGIANLVSLFCRS